MLQCLCESVFWAVGEHTNATVFCVNQCFGHWWNTQMLRSVCVKANLAVSIILCPHLKKQN